MPKGTDPVFIDLDLNKMDNQWSDTAKDKADVIPPTETPPAAEAPKDAPVVVPTPAPAPEVTPPAPEVIPAPADATPAPADDWQTPPASDTPADDEDPETALKKALGLADKEETIVDKLPDSPEKVALQTIIDQQKATIEALQKDKEDALFSKEEKDTKLKDMERLFWNLDEDNSMKQLLLYSTKAKKDPTFADKKVAVLKEMLKAEGFDIDALDKLKIEQEKTALWAPAGSSKMTVDYKWNGDGTDGFIPL